MEKALFTKKVIAKAFKVSKLKALFLCIGVLSWFIIACVEHRREYLGMILLPAVYVIATIPYDLKKCTQGIATLMLNIFYFLRYTIFPVVIVLGEYFCDFEVKEYLPFLNHACILMCVELLVVYIALYLISFRKNHVSIANVGLKKHNFTNKLLLCVTVVALLYNFLLYVRYPQLLTSYWGVIGQHNAVDNLDVLIENMGGELYYPFKMSAEFLKIVLIAVPFVKIINSKKIAKGTRIVLLLVLAFLALFIGSAEQINSILLTFVLGCYTLIHYVKKSDLLFMIGCVVIIVGFFVVMSVIADVTNIKGLARILNNYFCGPIDIAAGIGLKDTLDINAGSFVNDFIASIPILERLSVAETIPELYGITYNIRGQILPLLAYGYLYFGDVFCFLPALLVVLMTAYFDKIVAKSYGYIKIPLIYCAIKIAVVSAMYTMTIFYSMLIYVIAVPWLIYFVGALIGRYKGYRRIR